MKKQLTAWKQWLLDCLRYARANAPNGKKPTKPPSQFDLCDPKGTPPLLGLEFISRWNGGGRDNAIQANCKSAQSVVALRHSN
jgi:hypothetical protein